MSRISCFFLGLLAGALTVYAAINFHVVRARDGFHVVAKQPPRMSQAYVDIRKFGVADWANHPQLSTALVQANQQQLMGDAAGSAIQDGIHQILPSWTDPSVTR